MQTVKKTAEYKIFKRGDERYAVKNANGQPINGDEKVAILQAEKLLVAPEKKPEPVEEPAAEETPAEETPAEEEPKK